MQQVIVFPISAQTEFCKGDPAHTLKNRNEQEVVSCTETSARKSEARSGNCKPQGTRSQRTSSLDKGL